MRGIPGPTGRLRRRTPWRRGYHAEHAGAVHDEYDRACDYFEPRAFLDSSLFLNVGRQRVHPRTVLATDRGNHTDLGSSAARTGANAAGQPSGADRAD